MASKVATYQPRKVNPVRRHHLICRGCRHRTNRQLCHTCQDELMLAAINLDLLLGGAAHASR